MRFIKNKKTIKFYNKKKKFEIIYVQYHIGKNHINGFEPSIS